MPERRPTVTVATRLYVPEASAASFRMQAVAESLAVESTVTVLTTLPPSRTSLRSSPSAEFPDDEPSGIRVKRMPVLRDRSGAIRGYLQYLSFDIPLLARLLVDRGDAIVAEAPPTTGLVALIAARLRRRPLVYYPGDVWTDGTVAMGAPSVVTSVMRWIEGRVVKGARLTLAVSPEVAGRFVALGASPSSVVTVGNGIDTRVFRPDVTPPETARPYFVYTGTMSEWQRPGIFIRALAELSDDVELRFFGQGVAEAELRALAEEIAPGRVHFGGVVEPAVAAEWIRGAVAAVVSIVPGIGYDFARPTKLYAAAACGTPVLFAGPDTGRRLVREAGLGEDVDFDQAGVTAAMRRMLDQHRSDRTEGPRPQLVAWAREHASLEAVGHRSAQAIMAAITGRTGSGH